jgi:crossover junction endodeoxyribonuclease RusA
MTGTRYALTRAPAQGPVTIDLPLPPSVNHAYRNVPGRGRVASRGLKDWKEAAGWELKLEPRGQVTGPYTLSILVAEKMRGDVDNRIKAVSDLLVEHRITADDRKARGVSCARSPAVAVGRCKVTIEPVSEE